MEATRWTSWYWNSGCSVLKWEYRGNASLWYAVLNHLTEGQLVILWRGVKPDCEIRLDAVDSNSVRRVQQSGYRFSLCKDAATLSAIQSANPNERCLLFDPGAHYCDGLDVQMLNEAFSLPDSVSPTRAMYEGWRIGERSMVEILGVPVASLLFWDGDFVDIQSKRHSLSELDEEFQTVAEHLNVDVLRDDDL